MTLGTAFPSVLEAAKAGSDEAVAVLFREFNPPLVRFLRAQAPQAGDDLAAEVWLAVTRHLPAFGDDEAGFRRWLFSIGRRRLVDHRRRWGRQRVDPAPAELFETRAGGHDPAETVVTDLSARRAIAWISGALPPDQAEVILLRVVAGLSAAEVGELTGRSAGAIRVAQHRALCRLATALRQRSGATEHPVGGGARPAGG